MGLIRFRSFEGCNSVHSHKVLDPAYEFMGAALNKTGRPVLYSCSWPDYIRTDSLKEAVDYANTAKHCNIWRMVSSTLNVRQHEREQ